MNRTLRASLRAVRAVQRTLKWVNAASPARFAEAIAAYFPGIDKSTLNCCLARYKMLAIWGQDCRTPETGYERLVRSLVSGGFVPSGVPFGIAVDNRIANESCTPTLRRRYVEVNAFRTSQAHAAGTDICAIPWRNGHGDDGYRSVM